MHAQGGEAGGSVWASSTGAVSWTLESNRLSPQSWQCLLWCLMFILEPLGELEGGNSAWR